MKASGPQEAPGTGLLTRTYSAGSKNTSVNQQGDTFALHSATESPQGEVVA